MAIHDVVRRVEDDLAAGHSFVAIQRLTTLVQENPKDLELRRRLAAIHLATGNFVEAGRWSYLNRGSRDARATAAFEKAYRDPQARLAALRWPHDPANDPQQVNDVLASLQDELIGGSTTTVTGRAKAGLRQRSRVAGLVAVMFLCLIPVFSVIGLVTVVRWLWPG